MRTLCKTSNSLYTDVFLNEIKEARWTRFLSTVILCREFKVENIFSRVHFCGQNVCGNFYLQASGKVAKIRTRKHFVPHGKLNERRNNSKLVSFQSRISKPVMAVFSGH